MGEVLLEVLRPFDDVSDVWLLYLEGVQFEAGREEEDEGCQRDVDVVGWHG